MGEKKYWSNMWEGTLGFLKTMHNGKVPDKFYDLITDKPKVLTVTPVRFDSTPMTQAL